MSDESRDKVDSGSAAGLDPNQTKDGRRADVEKAARSGPGRPGSHYTDRTSGSGYREDVPSPQHGPAHGRPTRPAARGSEEHYQERSADDGHEREQSDPGSQQVAGEGAHGYGRSDAAATETHGGDSGRGGTEDDVERDYRAWHDAQIRAMDDEFRAWRAEREKRFETDAQAWRRRRAADGLPASIVTTTPGGRDDGLDETGSGLSTDQGQAAPPPLMRGETSNRE